MRIKPKMPGPRFRTNFDPSYGHRVQVAPGIERITAPNASAFTFHGTNTYILGEKKVAVIDPGPLDDDHYQTILRAIDGREVTHILITHTHVDHSPLAARLAQETGAATWAEGIHRPARELHRGEINHLEESGDKEFLPNHLISHNQIIEGGGWAVEALLTPGHTANHVCFAVKNSDFVFSGDHVMGWATSIVAPPDGSMHDYMKSLDIMIERQESVYFPGHGGRLEKAREFARALRAHRKMRETAILSRIRNGDGTIPEIVAVLYKETDPKLHGAAGLSVFAHIEDLVEKGLVFSETGIAVDAKYRAI